MSQGFCDPVGSLPCCPMEREAHGGAGVLPGLMSLWGPMSEQSVPERLHPVERTHAGEVDEDLQPVGRTHAAEVHGGLFALGGTPR